MADRAIGTWRRHVRADAALLIAWRNGLDARSQLGIHCAIGVWLAWSAFPGYGELL
jgi:hypothetical protein